MKKIGIVIGCAVLAAALGGCGNSTLEVSGAIPEAFEAASRSLTEAAEPEQAQESVKGAAAAQETEAPAE